MVRYKKTLKYNVHTQYTVHKTSTSQKSEFLEIVLLWAIVHCTSPISTTHIQISKCIGWSCYVFYIRSIDDIVWSLSSAFCGVLLSNWIHLDFREFWLLVFDSNELCIRGNFSALKLSLTMLSIVLPTKITSWYLWIKSAWNRIFPIENHVSDEMNLIASEFSMEALSSSFLRCMNESSCSLFSKTKTFWQNHTKRNDIYSKGFHIFEMNEKWFCCTYLIVGQMQHSRWTTAKFLCKSIVWMKRSFSEMGLTQLRMTLLLSFIINNSRSICYLCFWCCCVLSWCH